MRYLFLIITLLTAFNSYSLDIPKGTFYFDNSKTQYSNVKFVYGSDSSNETHIISMTKEEESRWSVTFTEPVTDMYRYTFAETTLPDGLIEKTFSTVKEEISKTYNELRTATTDKAILIGGIFVPETGDNWAQGNWTTLNGTQSDSTTLPVMFIYTENNTEITSKDTYINATYYLDNQGIEEFKSIGRPDSLLPMEIRGRGNYTWTGFNKKPYRIKLGEKQKILGMNKSRHFTLLAHADDNLAFLRNTVGFELSRRLGLKYTPAQQPVEVVLNGNYIGLYFLTENVRIAKDRVNITEQSDLTTNTDSITGGWLIEIDNYSESNQVSITEGNGETIRFTYKSPEILSNEQKVYLTNQVMLMNNAIYNSDKNSTHWEDLIDMDSLARFYIVQEIMDNAESFHGSCYIHKDMGNDKKWIFGPVWDFGNSYHRNWQEFIYQNPPFGQNWIGEIAKFPRFQQKVIEIWKQFKGNDYAGLNSFIDDFCNNISTAAQYNAIKWPNYGNTNISSAKNEFNTYLNNRIAWLVQQWGEGINGIDSVQEDNSISIFSFINRNITITAPDLIKSVEIYDISGKLIIHESPHSHEWITPYDLQQGIYIIIAKTTTDSIHSKINIR